ncbi:hypothetical protein F5B22DRAFT_646961 [Xylaria bambusicola]|uniref:uncharacterized protein n=1 Tax=Xylaria bambusicola TaxID=326684 RepID=UPI0020073FE1|nr:uncharacterized protein F5B22DRAFT_646961 [Xylaria bambusicola]KAI0515084.1 hypothetical protein F5B22DRAFT_646961 [Xylaria bambusicola]
MSEQTFVRFNQLPTEVRWLVWAEYALPRGPMLHELSYVSGSPGQVLVTSVHRDFPSAENLSTIRPLMKVNWESRERVLAGRQVQIRVDGSDDLIKITYKNDVSGRSYFEMFRPNGLHGFFFVKWDIDVFLWQNNFQASTDNILKSSCL